MVKNMKNFKLVLSLLGSVVFLVLLITVFSSLLFWGSILFAMIVLIVVIYWGCGGVITVSKTLNGQKTVERYRWFTRIT